MLVPIMTKAQNMAAVNAKSWLRCWAFISNSFLKVRPADQASWVDTEVMAGAMLVPMVMKAHAIAANTEANWVRVESVILKFLQLAFRDVPVMSMRLHEPCQQCEIS
jgi:hypothetical protein